MVNCEKTNKKNITKIIEKIIYQFRNNLKDEVLIKPNWGGRLPIIPGENTETYFLKILTDVISNYKVKKIYIAHYSLLKIENRDYSFEQLLKITRANRVKFPKLVEFLNLDNVEKEIVKIGEFNFNLPKIIKNVYYINLSKLKTHMETKVSLCLKNQMGLLPTDDKLFIHRNDLEKGIASLASILKPDLCIIDGIISMDKDGPHHGRTRKTHILVYSDNIVEADALGSYLMNYDPSEIRHIKVAENFGIGKIPSRDNLENYKEYKLKKFVLPKEYLKKLNLIIWPTTACSKCIFSLDQAKRYLKRDPFLLFKLLISKNDSYNIVLGKADNLKNKSFLKIITIGECTKSFAEEKKVEYLRGCPPEAKIIYQFIKNTINKK